MGSADRSEQLDMVSLKKKKKKGDKESNSSVLLLTIVFVFMKNVEF